MPSVEVLDIHVSQPPKIPPQLTADVRNLGPGTAEVAGACEFTCTPPITMITGFLQTESGSLVNVGQVKTLPYGGGVGVICDGRHGLPLQMNCKFVVQPYPKNGTQTVVEYHKSMPAP